MKSTAPKPESRYTAQELRLLHECSSAFLSRPLVNQRPVFIDSQLRSMSAEAFAAMQGQSRRRR